MPSGASNDRRGEEKPGFQPDSTAESLNPFDPPVEFSATRKPEESPRKPMALQDKLVLLFAVVGGAFLEAVLLITHLGPFASQVFPERVFGLLAVAIPCATFFVSVFWAFVAVTRGEDFIIGRVIKATIFATVSTPAAFILFATTCGTIFLPAGVLLSGNSGEVYVPFVAGICAAILICLLSAACIWIIVRQRIWR